MKEAYYFSHDSNARQDDRILELRAQFGWEGYGLFWAIIETLRDCTNYAYPSNARAGLALSLNIDKTKLEQFLNTAFSLGLFVEKDGVFFSESLMKRMEEIDKKRAKRAEAGRLGGQAKAMLKQKSSNAKAKSSKESKVKERKVKESKEEEKQNTDAAFAAFVSLFNELTKSNFKGCKKSAGQFAARRKEGANRETFTKAIKNCMADPFHKENPTHLTPEFITRPDKYEKYLNAKTVTPAKSAVSYADKIKEQGEREYK